MPYKNKQHKILSDYILTQALFKKSVEYLGGKCSLCQNSNIHILCFHHLDKSTKEFDFGGSRIRKSFDKIELELDKCQLLCINCHKEIHYNDKEILSYSQYRHRKFKNLLLSYKNKFNCEQCSYSKCEGALEFHHTNSVEKEIQLSNLTKKSYKSIDDLDKHICYELEKCMVLCSNCHMLQHTNIEKYNLYKDKIEEKFINYKPIKRVDLDKLKELYNSKIKIEDIATIMGHYPATIYVALHKLGLHI